MSSDPTIATLQLIAMLLAVVVGLLIEAGLLYGVYFILTLPLRRNERARIFLDILQLGLKDGQTPEAAIINASTSNDKTFGARFHILAAHLEKGMRLSAGLDLVPRLLPPQVIAMLKTGERIGDVSKVLPACRRVVGDGQSQVRGALNYVLILALVVSPAAIIIPIMLNVMVIPKFKEVFGGMYGGQLPAFTRFVMGSSHTMFFIQLAVICVTWFLLFAYVGGPRVRGWFRAVLGPLPDWIHFHLPWRRKRLQRDFSAMLAVLLDAHVPESEAVILAGDCTANSIVRRRAERIRAQLTRGVKLPEAIRAIDNAGELQWRLTNALQRGRDFLAALNGWHEALESKAFQQEQTAAQITTTGLVLFNGLIIACVVIGLFLPLIALINAATLW
ncbi:MAG TPA: type II secretion system F family protein [Verrucomicrobiae bacterium]|nr:type II secretion system F family protein [Verrucomicrobiae bacterium]